MNLLAVALMPLALKGQDKTTPATIFLKEGGVIKVHHFGQKDCNGSVFYGSYIMIRGKYAGDLTEIKDYGKIQRVELINFNADPVASVGNEKGKIMVYKTNGVSVQLEDAELLLSCYGVGEMYNQLKVQMINPISEKAFEKTVDVKNIKTIVFN